jgi:hypothetical protein
MEAAEIEKELAELETKAEHLRALYEQYFMGYERLEPLVHRRDVERRVRALRREQLRNTAQRFKFNTLVQRLNTMQQYWSRVVREIENGTFRRDVIRAAARFGEGALTTLGQKKTKSLLAAVAVAAAKSKRSIEDTLEIHDDDLIEDEEKEEEDDPPTPPKLDQRDLPVVGVSFGVAARPAAPAPVAPPQPAPVVEPAPMVQPALGGAARVRPLAAPPDPMSMIRPAPADVKRPAAGFGVLDIDLDDTPSGSRAVPSGAAMPPARGTGTGPPLGGAKPMGPLPAATPPPTRPSAPQARPAAQGGSFGVLDISLDKLATPSGAPAPAAPPRTAAAVPAAQRPPGGALPRAVPSTAVAPARPAVAGSGPRDEGDLSDGRIRQIYAKYVDTKRATQESTAGVTYEKLATSLRAQASKLKATHPDRSIDYEVVIKDGKTHLKPVLR